jgi:hypothetical protein
MEILVVRDRDRLTIAEYVSETDKLYKVKRISLMKWENMFVGSQVRKTDCIYKGELLNIAETIDEWNKLSKEEDEELSNLSERYETERNKLLEQLKIK